MPVPMKILDRAGLLRLNENSLRAQRKQNLKTEQIPDDSRRRFIVNFHFDHEWKDIRDVRLSVILKPGVTAWLDVSAEEYAAIPEFELSELDWEAAVCVGTPRWVE